ncbi:MAG: Cache 3/Cache 2 fusion domain-containing protein, partial [Beijerinckiaceae bacterium]
MKFPSLRLSLASKATLGVAATLLALCGFYAYANVESFRQTSAEINETRIYDRIRVFAHAVERTVPGSKVEFAKLDRVSRVVVPTMPTENDVAIVDAAGDPYGASLNARDKANGDIVRLTSSVFGPDGQRLKGQRIPGASPIGQGLAKGEVVISPLVVAGIPRLAIYVPLTTQSGEIVGAISSGIPMVQAKALEENIVNKAVIGTAVFLVASLLAIAGILAVLLRPLGGLAKSIHDMSNDRAINRAGHSRRSDEVGIIARALSTLDARLAERRAMQAETAERANEDVSKREALTKAVS